MLEKGIGTAKDPKQALFWCRQAAQQGIAEAQEELADRYQMGRGVAKDDKLAVHWWLKAGEQGHTVAQRNLGAMYFLGYGVPKDYVTAYMWLNLAASNRDRLAKRWRETVAKEMTRSQIAKGQQRASEWLEQRAGNRHEAEGAREMLTPAIRFP